MNTHIDEQVRDNDGHFGVCWKTYVDSEIEHVKETIELYKDSQDEAITLARQGQEKLLKDFPITYALKGDVAPLENQIKKLSDDMVGKIEHTRVREDVEKLTNSFAKMPAEYVTAKAHEELMNEVKDLREFKITIQSVASTKDVDAVKATAINARIWGYIGIGIAVIALIMRIFEYAAR